MIATIDICFECQNFIKKGNRIYRAFDSTFCSIDCQDKRYDLIKKIDPQLKLPTIWKSITEADVVKAHLLTLKRSKSCSEINPSPPISLPPSLPLSPPSHQSPISVLDSTFPETLSISQTSPTNLSNRTRMSYIDLISYFINGGFTISKYIFTTYIYK